MLVTNKEMFSKITPKSIKVSSFNLKKTSTSQWTIHLNFTPCNMQQIRFYAKAIESENENVFIPPTNYPKGILRTDLEKRKKLGGDIVMSANIWQFIKQTSKRGVWGKLSLVLGFFFIIYAISYMINLYWTIQNNLTIALKDAERLSDANLMSAVEYYTARDFPRILAGHPIFNYSSPIVLQQHSAVAEITELDSFGLCHALKSKFSLPPSLDVQLFFTTEVQPNYVAREQSEGAISVRHDYEYLIHFNKIVLYFVKEKKSQVVPKNDKFFPKRNILSSVHYEKLYDDFYKKARTDEINLTRSRGEINEDTESKMIEREMELQRQDKAIKEHQDVKKR